MLRKTLSSIAAGAIILTTNMSAGDVPHKYNNHIEGDHFTVTGYLKTIAFIESSSNYKAKNGGAYQLKPGTLKNLLDRMPPGITKSNWMKPANQDFLATRLMAEAVHAISRLEAEKNTLNLYLYHQLGSGLFKRMITSVVSGMNHLNKRDLNLLRSNNPCKIVSSSNGTCKAHYNITGAKSYYDAWRSEFNKAGILINYDKKQVIFALHSRYIWKLKLSKNAKSAKSNPTKTSKTQMPTKSHALTGYDTNLDHVKPQALRFFNDFKAYMSNTFGIRVSVKARGGFRSRATQLRTYAKGRTKRFKNLRNGKPTRVTWTMSSFHTHGQALDIVWHPTYSKVVSRKIINSMNMLIARQMRKFASDHCYGAHFLSLRNDPNHVQFGKIPSTGKRPTKSELRKTKSWGWFHK